MLAPAPLNRVEQSPRVAGPMRYKAARHVQPLRSSGIGATEHGAEGHLAYRRPFACDSMCAGPSWGDCHVVTLPTVFHEQHEQGYRHQAHQYPPFGSPCASRRGYPERAMVDGRPSPDITTASRAIVTRSCIRARLHSAVSIGLFRGRVATLNRVL